MIWKLTDSIWWGNVESPRECLWSTKSVLCVAENRELADPQLSPYAIHIGAGCTSKPVFWLPRNDYVSVDHQYVVALNGVLKAIDSSHLYPLLIHCYAGIHRSPAVAIYAASVIGGGDYKSLVEKSLQLRPEIEYHDFSKSLHSLMSGDFPC